MKRCAVLLLVIGVVLGEADKHSWKIKRGCYRDVQCGANEYCSLKTRGCIPIPQCEEWQARKDGWDYGECIKCQFDEECRWTVGFERNNTHKYCWGGDGVCREKPPLLMQTYAWKRKYDSKSGFIDTLTPRSMFVDGQAMCFVVSTPLPPELAQYLKVQIDWVQMCALRQSSMEALIRIEEAQRVEKHHGVSGAHRHHGILPYDPRTPEETGCRTDEAKRLNVKRMTLEQSLRLDDFGSERDIPLNTTFTVVDSSSGAAALCTKATAISPKDVPFYTEIQVSVFHGEESIGKLLEREQDKPNGKEVDQVAGLLSAYGVFGEATTTTKSIAQFPSSGPTQTDKKWTTLVVSDLKDSSYVVCDSETRYNRDGYCVNSNFDGESYLALAILSLGLLVFGGIVFCVWPPAPAVVVI